VILCPNTSPLLILARIDRLDLLGDPARVVMTQAVLDEIRDKHDAATAHVDALVRNAMPVVTPSPSATVDASRSLGPGERSVLSWALDGGAEAVCAGLYLTDSVLAAALRRLGETWPRRSPQ
jgi:predicted nucleic acid-binding protein